jgi:hypothetical protein
MNAMMPSAPKMYIEIEPDEVHPQARPCSATISSGTTPTMMVNAPHQSIFCFTGW